MRAIIVSILSLVLAPPAALNFTMNSLDGKPVNLAKYEGNVVLMVNVASRCGFTPQYTALEKVYEKIMDKGKKLTGIKKKLFFWEHNLATKFEINKNRGFLYNLQLSIANKIIFDKWREALGNELVCIVSGGAACQVKAPFADKEVIIAERPDFGQARVELFKPFFQREGIILSEKKGVLDINSAEVLDVAGGLHSGCGFDFCRCGIDRGIINVLAFNQAFVGTPVERENKGEQEKNENRPESID